jgi:hypothetical protein
VGAEPDELEAFGVGQTVDQDEIGLDVAVTMVDPLSNECMISAPQREGLIRQEEGNDCIEIIVQRKTMPASLFPFVVLLEAGGEINRPH